MRKRDYQANSLSAVWQLFSSSYQEAIQSLTCPVRATYALQELGPTRFSLDPAPANPETEPLDEDVKRRSAEEPLAIEREDLQLRNVRGQALECSFWRRAAASTEEPPPPCVIYLHGLSSSRKECVYVRDRVLARGFSLFTLDLSGSGLSEGEFLSFGHFEKDDLRAAVEFLYATNRASRIALWGRCVGGATALLYLCDSVEFEYKTLQLAPRDAHKLQLGQCRTTGAVLCVRPGRVFSFRVTPLNVHNGDMVVLSINGRMVQGMDMEACRKLLIEKCSKGTVQVCGYVRRGSTATAAAMGATSRDSTSLDSRSSSSADPLDAPPLVFALVLDSTYGDMERVIADMLLEISKSAEKRDVSVPSAMLTTASKIISRSVRKTAGFHFSDVAVVDSVHALTQIPCQFVSASKVDFIRPEHTRALFDAYGGDKHWLAFDGVHDQNRPDEVVEAICSHLESRSACN
jgi:hypothetical protein